MLNFRRVVYAAILVTLQISAGSVTARSQESERSEITPNPPLTVEQVVQKLEENTRERTAALREFQGTRIYHMQYRGFPGDRDAEMVVNVAYRAPNTKEFTVVSKSGNKFLLDHVLNKLLQGEQEAASAENRRRTALDTSNYSFTLLAVESSLLGPQYVLAVDPKANNKFLYRGKIWVDAKEFALTRIEGEPARNPSFWIKKTEIAHHYQKVGDFWLPAENHSESWIRIGGRAVLSIEYKDYKLIQSSPLHADQERSGAQAARSAAENHPI